MPKGERWHSFPVPSRSRSARSCSLRSCGSWRCNGHGSSSSSTPVASTPAPARPPPAARRAKARCGHDAYRRHDARGHPRAMKPVGGDRSRRPNKSASALGRSPEPRVASTSPRRARRSLHQARRRGSRARRSCPPSTAPPARARRSATKARRTAPRAPHKVATSGIPPPSRRRWKASSNGAKWRWCCSGTRRAPTTTSCTRNCRSCSRRTTRSRCIATKRRCASCAWRSGPRTGKEDRGPLRLSGAGRVVRHVHEDRAGLRDTDDPVINKQRRGDDDQRPDRCLRDRADDRRSAPGIVGAGGRCQRGVG